MKADVDLWKRFLEDALSGTAGSGDPADIVQRADAIATRAALLVQERELESRGQS